MTRGRLIARVAATVGLDIADSEEIVFLREWANEAVVDVLMEARLHAMQGDVTLTANVWQYRVSNALAILDFQTDNGGDITQMSLDELTDLRRVNDYTGEVSRFAWEGDLLSIYPTPSTASDVHITYVAAPSPMTDDADDPSEEEFGGVPERFHRCLEYYMLWRAAEYDSKKSPFSAQEYRQFYQEELVNARKRWRHMANRGITPARAPGYPGGSMPRRNDTYPER